MRVRVTGLRAAWLALVLLPVAVSCRGGGSTLAVAPPEPAPNDRSVPSLGAAPASAFGNGKIQHIVIVMQENRSFDNLFHGYPGANTVGY